MDRVRRGVVADALVAAGATMLLLQSTSASARSVAFSIVGAALVVVGLALLWGVPRPSFKLRGISSIAGFLFGYALVAPVGPSTWVAVGGGLVVLALAWGRAAPRGE